MREQVVVGDGGEVGKLEVIDELGEALFNLLFDVGMTTAKDLPEPGVPRTILARKGLTTLIQPSFHFFL